MTDRRAAARARALPYFVGLCTAFTACLAPKYSEVDSLEAERPNVPNSKAIGGSKSKSSFSSTSNAALAPSTTRPHSGGTNAISATVPSLSGISDGGTPSVGSRTTPHEAASGGAGGANDSSIGASTSQGFGGDATTSRATQGKGGTTFIESHTQGAGGSSLLSSSTASLPSSCSNDLICNHESCCTTISMQGSSEFLRGRGKESCNLCSSGCPPQDYCLTDEGPEESVTVSDFKLDKYLVTVGRMKNFVANYDSYLAGNHPTETEGVNPSNSSMVFKSGWKSFLPTNAEALKASLHCSSGAGYTEATFDENSTANDNYPVNCVTWVVASAFCIWDGGRLPSELEWEYAAAGGTSNRVYPWGNAVPTADHSRVVAGLRDAFVAVGSYPAGAGFFEHQDLVGLLFQWTYDLYDAMYYEATEPCVNCSNFSIGLGKRSARGGAYASSISLGFLRAARRFSKDANTMIASPSYGIRCAR